METIHTIAMATAEYVFLLERTIQFINVINTLSLSTDSIATIILYLVNDIVDIRFVINLHIEYTEMDVESYV